MHAHVLVRKLPSQCWLAARLRRIETVQQRAPTALTCSHFCSRTLHVLSGLRGCCRVAHFCPCLFGLVQLQPRSAKGLIQGRRHVAGGSGVVLVLYSRIHLRAPGDLCPCAAWNFACALTKEMQAHAQVLLLALSLACFRWCLATWVLFRGPSCCWYQHDGADMRRHILSSLVKVLAPMIAAAKAVTVAVMRHGVCSLVPDRL